jgi:hypothetical protein
MGWSSGSILMQAIIGAIKPVVPDEKLRQRIYTSIIPEFENSDCDTLYECEGTDDAFDAAMVERHGKRE